MTKRGNIRFDEQWYATHVAKARELNTSFENAGVVVNTDQPPSARTVLGPAGATAGMSRAAGRPQPENLFVSLCRAHGLVKPVTEYRFHPVRLWRFDYAWPLSLLALEVEGGVWMNGKGAHSRPINIERDIEKYSEAAIMGYRILRCQPDDLMSVGLDYVKRALTRRL